MARSEVRQKPVLGSWQALLDYLAIDMAHLTVERVRVLYLDSRNRLVRDHVASEGTIGDAIRMAVKNKSLRKRYADIGHAFAQQYHAEKPALQRLAEVYHEAIELRRAAPDDVVEEHRRGAGVFRTDGKPDLRLRLASRYVWFKDGQAEVTDPELAQRLRRMATNGNAYGIVEVGA